MSDNPIGQEAIDLLARSRDQILTELSKVIVGQQEVIEQLLISMFSRGHCLLEGVPGLAKTLMISTIAQSLDLSFTRIQFTPDLMPADITGTEIIEENKTTGARETAVSLKVPCSPMSSSPMKSIARRQKPRRHCSKRCRNAP